MAWRAPRVQGGWEVGLGEGAGWEGAFRHVAAPTFLGEAHSSRPPCETGSALSNPLPALPAEALLARSSDWGPSFPLRPEAQDRGPHPTRTERWKYSSWTCWQPEMKGMQQNHQPWSSGCFPLVWSLLGVSSPGLG